MIRQMFVRVLLGVTVLFLSGCASVFYPDFDEDSDIVVDDGGKVEVRKVENKGVLVADKDNALYEGDEEKKTDDEDKDVTLGDDDKVAVSEVASVEPEAVNELKKVENESVQDKAQNPSMRYLAGVVYFANGGSGIDADGRAVLKKIAQTAKQNNAKVEVYGFASSRTRNTDPVSHKLANFKVSAERADETARVLRSLGVKSDNMTVQALSDSMPLYKEVMPEGERLNRRAEIYLTY